ncbi:ATP-dependent helicase [Ancylomarina salipaludis]|uniref:DNA 3'-5' helicase n=1 Tax=Ancylomarina salipaludis TaxID=2501299 RepID=A0A4Q1JIP1_9BACT|nr:ATP-dependent helicase [Ancylomarina salipaludis]RXQ89493.1 ATP-dependent helicase [Ancylomarina salipaludis]
MNKVNLSEKQAGIVHLEHGSFLVLASAGSGKTRVLTERVKRLSESNQGKILAITFTNKAAAEIKERLGSSEKINKNVFVGTFHSFCQSILELRFKLLGYKKMPHIFEDDSDRIELIKEAIESIPYFKEIYDDLDTKQKNQYTYNALQFISTVKRELISPDELVEGSKDEELKYLYKNYQDILKSNNAIDFDDIIKLVYDLFTNNDAVANLYRKAYSFICIDECQDLNKLQYFLLKALCGSMIQNVMMVGDPNQSIYGFNGSASTFMQEDFINDFSAQEIVLDENYRCSKTIIEASNQLMDLDVEAVNYVIEGVFQIQALDTDQDEAIYVANKIKELVNLQKHSDIEGEITYERISILARNKFVFKNIEGMLLSEEIPFYYKSGNSGIKFTSSSMKIFDLFFRIKINPLDRLHQKKLEDYIKVRDVNDIEELQKSIYPISLRIKKLVDEISMENIHLKIEELRIIFNEEFFDDDERKLTLDELDDFNTQLIQYKKQNIKTSLEGFKAAIALGITKNNNIKETGVCLSTVHTMKGQESEIVFLIGMDDGTFPDYRAINKGGEELNQEKNNTYVAFTRAKRFLFVSYPKKRMMPWGDYKQREISRFLSPLI